MLVQKLIPAIALIVLFSSCGVPKPFQKALYLQDSVTEAEKVVTPKIAVIEFGDRLSIGITAINKEAADAFNASAATSASGAQGYLVDSAGNIQLLQLGLIHAAGLTPAQLEANIEQQLADYIKGPVVSVSITNFKISVFGEVGNPGVINVPDGKITILQAIVQSGDVAMFGKRDNILVIREENGKRQFGRVDLNSNNIFLSPYYNLKQNDMIYVEAYEEKYINNNPRLDRDLRNLAVATTLLSTVLLIINLTKK